MRLFKATKKAGLMALVLVFVLSGCNQGEPSKKAAYMREVFQKDLLQYEYYVECTEGLPESIDLADMHSLAGHVTSPEFKQEVNALLHYEVQEQELDRKYDIPAGEIKFSIISTLVKLIVYAESYLGECEQGYILKVSDHEVPFVKIGLSNGEVDSIRTVYKEDDLYLCINNTLDTISDEREQMIKETIPYMEKMLKGSDRALEKVSSPKFDYAEYYEVFKEVEKEISPTYTTQNE